MPDMEPMSVTPESFKPGNPKADRILKALATAPDGAVVEIGCLRTANEWPSDGWSTLYLARAAEARGLEFYSYDIDEDAVAIANRVLGGEGFPPLVEERDGIEGLEEIEGVGFLYLDGSDDPSETLEQFEAADLLDDAVVVVDDVQMMDWHKLHGKGTSLIPMLRERGIRHVIYRTLPGYSMLVVWLGEQQR